MMKMYFSTLLDNEAGASVMEFGLIAPVAMLMILGTMDIGHSHFVRATLDGAMQTAARTSALEGSAASTKQALIDLRVKEAVLTLAPSARVTATRRYYKTFSEAALARAESVIEDPAAADLRCDAGEVFMDANQNGVWDADGGSDGQGGARDIVLIKYQVSYPRLFPMAKLMGWPENVELETNSILANQPYGEQSANGTPVQTDCPSD